MEFPRRTFLSLAGAVAAAPAMLHSAFALDYPTRPITIIVPFPAGGPVDTLARLLSEPMRIALGQPLIVENVGGAGGSIAVARVARAEPDGYTMILGNWTSLVGTPAVYPVPFDVKNDFAAVALLAFSPLMLVGRKSLPANNVKELIAWLKANPGKATSGTIGVGSPSQVGAIYFQKLTGTQIQLVPYRGAAPALTDLLAGQIDLRMGAEASQMLPYLKSDSVKAFAIMDKTRWAPAPDIPDHRGGRRAGACAVVLAGILGAEGNARGDRRQAQCRGGRRLGRHRDAPTVGRTGSGNPAARTADATGARRLSPV